MKILLVDDDIDDRQTFAQTIQELKIPAEITFARDYIELLKNLEKTPDYDLIILDINMPFVNGRQCLVNLKTDARYKDIPVIIYTVSVGSQDINHAYKNGAHYYVIKPYTKINFHQTLEKIFSIDWTTEQPIPSREDFVINMAVN